MPAAPRENARSVDRPGCSASGRALHALGVDGRRPPLALAGRDPRAYAAELAGASAAAALTDSAGLGAFWWLVQPLDRPIPAVLARG